MPEKQPDPKPKPGTPEIPVGKLVGGKSERPLAPRPKPSATAAPAAVPATVGEFDVDLVAIPFPPPRKSRDERSYFDFDRRDFVMLGAGVGSSLIAVLTGLLMARLFQSKPAESKAPESTGKAKQAE